MARQITKDAREKGLAASLEKKAAQIRNRERRFTVGNWTAYRLDDWNFILEKVVRPAGEGNDQKHYPSFEDAVRGMLRELINDKCPRAGEVQAVVAAIKSAETAVCAALKTAREGLPT